MSRKARRVLILASIVCALLSLPWGSCAEDEFKTLVQHIESHFHVKRTRVPFLGAAGFALRVAHPHGVKDLKLAIFDEQHFDFKPGEDDSFDNVIRKALSDRWQPLIRVRSRTDHEHTYIYAREAGTDIEVMVVNLEEDEAAVIQAKVDPERLSSWLSKPSTHRLWEDFANGDIDDDDNDDNDDNARASHRNNHRNHDNDDDDDHDNDHDDDND